MPGYAIPSLSKPPRVKRKQVLLVASGDLRLAANQNCWPAQKEMEAALTQAVADAGYELVRAHPYKPRERHGFIGSQKEGMEIFRGIDPTARLIVAEAVWQYSHHVLHGLITHRGPILTVANWSGTWPGLVGMLNLNGSLTKAGVKYSTLWAEEFGDEDFRRRLRRWLDKGRVRHRTNHVTRWRDVKVGAAPRRLGRALARQLQQREGHFGRLRRRLHGDVQRDHSRRICSTRWASTKSGSASRHSTTKRLKLPDDEARAVREWMEKRGMTFVTGPDHDRDLTDAQLLLQCKMYIAAVRIADDFGCHTIGIQYQQGLKDLLPASDLVEGTLNNSDRPPVRSRDGKRVLYSGQPLPHFNEVDECAGLDGLMTYRVHLAMGQPVENTLHDLRWGDWDRSGTVDDYVWVFLISGSAPPAHFEGGWKGASSERQPAMYFPVGWRHAQRDLQAGRDRLVTDLRAGWPAA